MDSSCASRVNLTLRMKLSNCCCMLQTKARFASLFHAIQKVSNEHCTRCNTDTLCIDWKEEIWYKEREMYEQIDVPAVDVDFFKYAGPVYRISG